MSVLGFFRKHQKMVFIIMVVLMFIFLLTGWGAGSLSSLFAPRPENRPIGTVEGEKMTQGERMTAQVDIELLNQYLGLGNIFRVLAFATSGAEAIPGEAGYVLLQRNPEPVLCWALLLREADQTGVKVTDAAVDEFLSMVLGKDKAGLGEILADMSKSKLTRNDLYRAVRNYLRVAEAFKVRADGVVQSEDQLRTTFLNMARTMTLAIVQFRAADYTGEAPDPQRNDLLAMFNQYKALPPRDPQNGTPFQFGYLQPDKVQLEYIFIPLRRGRAGRDGGRGSDDQVLERAQEREDVLLQAGPHLRPGGHQRSDDRQRPRADQRAVVRPGADYRLRRGRPPDPRHPPRRAGRQPDEPDRRRPDFPDPAPGRGRQPRGPQGGYRTDQPDGQGVQGRSRPNWPRTPASPPRCGTPSRAS